MVQLKPLAGCVDQSSAHLLFYFPSFSLKLCPPDGPFSFPSILSTFSFFLSTISSQVQPASTCQYLQYLPLLPSQYSFSPSFKLFTASSCSSSTPTRSSSAALPATSRAAVSAAMTAASSLSTTAASSAATSAAGSSPGRPVGSSEGRARERRKRR